VQCCIPQKACHGDTAASARLQQPPGGPVATVIQPGPAAWRGRRHTGASSRHQCTQSPTNLCARLSRRQRQRLAAGDRHQLQQPAASVPVAAGATGATARGPSMGDCDLAGHSLPPGRGEARTVAAVGGRPLGGRRLAARGGFYHMHMGRALLRWQESAAEGPFVSLQQPAAAAAGGGRSIGRRHPAAGFVFGFVCKS